MKKMKRFILAFFLGELFVISKNDKKFQKKRKEKVGRDKVSLLFSALLDFNKKLVNDWVKFLHQESAGRTMQENLRSLKSRGEREYQALQNSLSSLGEERKKLNKEEFEQKLGDIKKGYEARKEKIEEKGKKWVQESGFFDKILDIRDYINSLLERKK